MKASDTQARELLTSLWEDAASDLPPRVGKQRGTEDLSRRGAQRRPLPALSPPRCC